MTLLHSSTSAAAEQVSTLNPLVRDFSHAGCHRAIFTKLFIFPLGSSHTKATKHVLWFGFVQCRDLSPGFYTSGENFLTEPHPSSVFEVLPQCLVLPGRTPLIWILSCCGEGIWGGTQELDQGCVHCLLPFTNARQNPRLRLPPEETARYLPLDSASNMICHSLSRQ